MARPESYHHGDLRRAAIDAALARLDSDASDPLGMRALAGDLGVAHRALYNHFADREALLRAIAAHGYRELAARVQRAESAADYVSVYAAFALERQGLYATMTSRTYRQFETDTELRKAVDRVIAASLATLAPLNADDDTRRRAVMKFWMLAHGGVSLHTAGVLRARSDAAFVDELLRIADLAPAAKGDAQVLWQSEPKEDPS